MLEDYARLRARRTFVIRPLSPNFDFAITSSYDSWSSPFSSTSGSTSNRCNETHLYRPTYGAGMIPSCSRSSANFSGVHLNARCGGTELSESKAKILPPTLKQRTSSHCRFSVTCGKQRQRRRTDSTSIDTEAPAQARVLFLLRGSSYTCSRASPNVTLTSIFFLPR